MILITGGAGFVGRHLARLLVGRGERVRVLDSYDSQVHGSERRVVDEVELLTGDVTDAEVWSEALDGVEKVVHLAAAVGVGQSMYEISHYCNTNVMGTAILLESLSKAASTKKLVVASSMSLYGEGLYVCDTCGLEQSHQRDPVDLAKKIWEPLCWKCRGGLRSVATPETMLPQPTSVYAVTKRDQEELCLTVGQAYGIQTVALRFFNIYGPGQSLRNPYTGVAAISAACFLSGVSPVVFEDGQQTRDFVHVTDIARACALALDSERAAGLAINLGTGRATSILDLVSLLRESLGGPEPQLVNVFRAGDIRHCIADRTLARDALGWEPSIELSEGIDDLVSSVRDQLDVRADLPRALAELRKRKLIT